MSVGFFYVQHTVGAMGGGQQLASPGSCLELFHTNAYIECNSRGQCHYFSDKYTFWMVTISGDADFNPNLSQQTLKAGSLLGRVSRCAVCILDAESPSTDDRIARLTGQVDYAPSWAEGTSSLDSLNGSGEVDESQKGRDCGRGDLNPC